MVDGDPLNLVTADGVNLAGWHLPPRPAAVVPDLAVVVGHGFSASTARPSIRRISRRLTRLGGVVAVDFRGHGRSGGRCSASDQEVLDVDAAVAWARGHGYRLVATLGFSMGGSTVLRHAARAATAAGDRPIAEVDAVVSVSAPSRWYYKGTVPMRRVHWLLESRPGRLVTAVLFRTRLGARWTVVPESPVEAVGRIPPIPLLIVHGDRDGYFPLEHGRALASAAGGDPAGVAAASGPSGVESLDRTAPAGARLWEVAGFGHAEDAVTPTLLDAIAGWIATAVRPPAQPRSPPAELPPVGPIERRSEQGWEERAVSEPEGPQGERVATTSVRPEERGPGRREERAQ